jgi:hypothetical protein
MNIDLLNTTFEVSESPGLDTFDPRLGDITTLAQDGKYDEVAPQIEALFAEKIYDIRVIGYYCFLVFLEQGVGGLGPLLKGLAGVLTDNWAAVGPMSNRPKMTQNSLNWFYRLLLKKLQLEEQSKGDGWQRWTGSVTSEQVGEAIEACDQLRRALVAGLEDQAGPVVENLSKVTDWLKAFERVVYREPEPEPDPEAEVTEAGGAATGTAGEAGAFAGDGSYHLQLLQRKMKVFADLVEAGEYARAALVSDDINSILGSFEPLLYFPKLFADYARLLALHTKDLTEFEGARETREWQAMKALYLVDLEGFLKL